MTARSCGIQSGDYLKLENQWARVTITCDAHDNPKLPYCICGDIKDFRLRGHYVRTRREAMAYALASLALFQTGRMT